MKHITTLLLSLALSITAGFAQNRALRIESFTHDPFDQAAKDYPMRDGSGDLRALVKVRPANKDLKFDFGYMSSVVDTKDHKGELWIYVQKNARNISITGDGYESIFNTDLGMTLSSGATYVLQLKYNQVQTTVIEEVTSQYVLFKMNVPNATVELNGQTLYATDGVLSKYLPFGTYNYRITAPNYESTEGVVTVNNPKEKHIETIQLVPSFTRVTLKTDAETEIWIDEVKRGTGTTTVELNYGTYLVESRKPNHRSTKQEIVVTKQNPRSTITLNAPTPVYGSLDITSTPLEATITIDGKNVGTTPNFIQRQLIGTHLLKIEKAGYQPFEQTVTITEGQTQSLTATLKEGPVFPPNDEIWYEAPKRLRELTDPVNSLFKGFCKNAFNTNILSHTFVNGKGVIKFNGDVTSIGDVAFYGCSLTSIAIPKSVTSIGYGALACCYRLTSITIPNSVMSIGNSAFRGSSSLTSITIPNSVKYIENKAFSYCSSLKEVRCEATEVPAVEDSSFGTPSDKILYVPASAIEQYRATKPWNEFKEIRAIP